LLSTVGEISTLLALALRAIAAMPLQVIPQVARVTARQVYFTGVHAILLIGLIGFLLGAIVVIQAIHQFPALGVEAFVGVLLVIAILRELGPLVVAVVVISRSGSAIAAELATMKIHGEVDDLEGMGIDPIQYLFVPRLLGMMVSLFGLMVYFNALAVFGGYVALGFWRTAPWLPSFVGAVTAAIEPADLALVPIKAAVYGCLIALFSTYRGLTVASAPTEVPRAATRAVVASLVGVFLADSMMAAVVYL
jgi:phospholipid/cholesterol/gamma-HCH transport system permease protein